MKIAACELWVDVPNSVQPLGFDLPDRIIATAAKRKYALQAAIEAAKEERADLLVFPLWTWPGDPAQVPRWIVDQTRGLAIVLGVFARHRRRAAAPTSSKGKASAIEERLYVISGGRVVAGGTEQQMANSSSRDLKKAGDLAALLLQRDGGRQWRFPLGEKGLLVACGENNVLRGGGPNPRISVEDGALERGLTLEFLKSFPVIANPTHTRQGPQASRSKKAALSRGGVCIAVGNAHSSYRYRWREDGVTTVEAKKASWRTAEFYKLGKRVPGSPLAAHAADLEKDGFRIQVLDA